MKKYILKSLFVSMLCMLAASCQDTDEFAQLDSRKAQVMFSVAMDSPSARSRANWDEDQYTPSELGNAYDNHIDLNQFVVKIEADGKNYELKDIIKWKVEAENKDEVSNEYKFVGVVEGVNKQTELEEVKISVFANMGSNAENLTFNQDAKNIPMWGVHSKDKLVLKPGVRQDVGAIYLLRAMAKIEVSISDDMVADGYSLNSVKLKKYNFKGNSLLENYSTYANTSEIDTETKNVNANDSRENLAFTPAEAGKKYIVYLPEVDNAEDEDKDKELKLILTLQKEGEEYIETELVVKDYTDNTGLIDIVRNHWYKYVISGIVNGEPTVEYSVVPWTGVDIEVGGEKFLVLNKDVIEIYNSNIDADQLKFSSSSPIQITLKDIYGHNDNGTFTEGATDNLSAYYVTKFGQKIQLGDDPGFSIDDKKNILDREKEILNAITATAEEGKLDGGITISSPYINHETYGDSHYDTPRYLEFEVENAQGLTASFRVVQYPPVVITNKEGYFSYREDYRVGDLTHFHSPSQFRYDFGKNKPKDNGEATHYKNPAAPFFNYSNFFPYHTHECTEDGTLKETDKSCGGYVGFDELVYGMMERDYVRIDEYKGSPKSAIYHREHYVTDEGSHFITHKLTPTVYEPEYIKGNENVYYQNLGPCYYDEETGKYYRRHYTGNGFNFYFSKYVAEVYENGKALINLHAPDDNMWDEVWDSWGELMSYSAYVGWNVDNHRIYHIRTTTTSSDYIIGWPKMTKENDRYYTAEGENNSKMVSPSFMVASQLGETIVPTDRDGYIVPKAPGMYPLAKRQCEQYVEAFYEDIHNDGYTPGVDPITHYDDWRLPTFAELELINSYQQDSRAMDQVLSREAYFCAALNPNNYNNNTILFDRRTQPAQGDINKYHMRCVRDVKPGEKLFTKIYPN